MYLHRPKLGIENVAKYDLTHRPLSHQRLSSSAKWNIVMYNQSKHSENLFICEIVVNASH